jgi:phage-related protein
VRPFGSLGEDRLDWQQQEDLVSFPPPVRTAMGYGLYEAQLGGVPDKAKPLKGFKGAGVVEIMEDHDGDTYRAVYTVRFAAYVFVLHAFQKKSKSGIATPKRDLELIHKRLADAGMTFRELSRKEKGND